MFGLFVAKKILKLIICGFKKHHMFLGAWKVIEKLIINCTYLSNSITMLFLSFLANIGKVCGSTGGGGSCKDNWSNKKCNKGKKNGCCKKGKNIRANCKRTCGLCAAG